MSPSSAGVRWGVCAYVALLATPLGPKVPLVLLALLLFYLVYNNALALRAIPHVVAITLGLFLAATGVSSFLSVSPGLSLTSSLSLVPALCLLLLVSSAFDAEQLGLLNRAITLTTLFIAIIFTAVAIGNPGLETQQWMDIANYPHFRVPNDLGILAVMGAFSVTSLCLVDQTGPRWLSVATLIMILTCLVIYKSRGSLLTLVLTVVIVVGVARPRQIALAVVLILLLIFGLDMLAGLPLTTKIMEVTRVTVRFPLWMSAAHMFVDAPLFGLGPGSYTLVYQQYVSDLELPAWVLLSDRHMPWPHNIFLELLAERGFFGLFTFLLFIAALYWTAIVALWGAIYDNQRSNLLAALFALTALLISGLYESSLLRHWVVILYFLLTGAICAAAKVSATLNDGAIK